MESIQTEARQPVRLDDPVFGLIEYEESHGVGLWGSADEGEIPGFSVSAPATGPSDQQRRLYADLRSRMATVQEECRAFIGKQDYPPATLAELTVYSIEIGSDEDSAAGTFVVELCDRDARMVHRVEFEGGIPEQYTADD